MYINALMKHKLHQGYIFRSYSWSRLRLVKSTSTLLIRLNIQSLIRYSGLDRQHEVIIRPPLDVLPIPTCDPFICFWVCLRVLSLTTNKNIFMYITSIQLETFSTLSDIINYILNCFFHCTIGCAIILTFIVNDMGSHRVHAYIVPCICSAVAWWWLFYGRNMQPWCNWYFVNAFIYICCVLDGKIHIEPFEVTCVCTKSEAS